MIEKISRLGVFGTFLGHGIIALTINPKWISFLTTVGFSASQAKKIMPFIGYLDIIIAFIILLYPKRYIVIWAIIWAFSTAIMRPISGDSILEFIERSSNWCLPVVLFLLISNTSSKVNTLKETMD